MELQLQYFQPLFFFDFNIGYSHWHRTVNLYDGTTSTEPGCGAVSRTRAASRLFRLTLRITTVNTSNQGITTEGNKRSHKLRLRSTTGRQIG